MKRQPLMFGLALSCVLTVTVQRADAGITSYSSQANAQSVVNRTRKAGGTASMNYDPKTKRWLVYQNFSARKPQTPRPSVRKTPVRKPVAASKAKSSNRASVVGYAGGSRIYTTYYAIKSNAEYFVRETRKAGGRATLHFDKKRKKWAVTEYYALMASKPVAAKTNAAVSGRNRTYTTYYAVKANAIHFVRQVGAAGGRATMYYDAGRAKWAVTEYYSLGPALTTSTQKTYSTPTTTTRVTTKTTAQRTNINYYSSKSGAQQFVRQIQATGGRATLHFDKNRKKWVVTEHYGPGVF